MCSMREGDEEEEEAEKGLVKLCFIAAISQRAQLLSARVIKRPQLKEIAQIKLNHFS